ncbi:MAG: NAD(P)/FAD-dependent oxidoreductase, partial [Halobacteriaceae archaeon]
MRIGIIGGGIYGTAIAYFLQQFGDPQVILFEKAEIGGESTSRSAGIIRHHYSRTGHIELAKRGREIIENFEEYVGQEAGFHRNGYLALTGAENEALFQQTIERQQQVGLAVETVDVDALDDHIDGIDATGVTAAALEQEAGFADPYLVAQGFANAAADAGVCLRSNTEVTDIAVHQGVVEGVETTDGYVAVDYLINAGGPWGAEVGEMVDLELPLTWHESKVVVLSSDTPYGIGTPTVSDGPQHMYVKPEPGGEFIVGGINRPKVDRDEGLEGV